jgi:hypothetical protein
MRVIAPQWGIVYLTEADGKLRHLDQPELQLLNPFLEVWNLRRHWAGLGAFTQMLIVRKHLQPHVCWVHWVGRSVGILMSPRPLIRKCEIQAEFCTLLIGTHCKYGGDITHIVLEFEEISHGARWNSYRDPRRREP